MQPTVDLVYFNAGGGHRAAALALRDALRGRPWRVRLVNLTQVLDPRQRFMRITGHQPEDLYNLRLRRGWTWGMATELKLLQAGIELAHGALLRRLQRHWADTAPDLVVSLIPNFNRALGESLAAARPGAPFATVMTDLADLPPRFWVEPRVQQHVVCGTPHAQRQALAAGVPRERVSLVSGMLIRPAFYAPACEDRAAARQALGLDPARPLLAVMFGGQGSQDMLRIARRLPDHQLLLFAGHDAGLADRLRALQRPAPQAVVGFTPEVPRLLRLADVFIGKPGPGALSEALQLGLPVITFDNAWTMPQERFNTRWVRELGVGRVLRSQAELAPAVEDICLRLDEYRARVQWLDNRAIHEVPLVLDELLRAAPQAQPAGTPATRTELSYREVSA